MTHANLLRSWRADRKGAATVELALVAPFLAVIVTGIINFAPVLDKMHRMRDAVAAGADYVMVGGTSPTAIQTVTLAAWTGHSQSDGVAVTQWCTCLGVTSGCTALCTDGTVPQGFTRIVASTTYSGLAGSQVLTADHTVRTR